MMRRVKKKKPRIHIFIIIFLVVVFVTFGYKFFIILENQHIFEKEYGDKAKPVTSSKIELDSSVSLSTNKLNSPNAILIRLKDHATIIQKNSVVKISLKVSFFKA
jgi:serine-type D-Ala-D-Ala carboxypeptidase (penicillin-binding protein 5/6)